jgi:hypothetical protein
MAVMPKLASLKQALHLTNTMYQQAQAENWSALPDLQQQRHVLLDAVFPVDAADNIDAIRPLLEQMIAMNQQLETCCKNARQALHVELNGLNKNKKAVAAYHSN